MAEYALYFDGSIASQYVSVPTVAVGSTSWEVEWACDAQDSGISFGDYGRIASGGNSSNRILIFPDGATLRFERSGTNRDFSISPAIDITLSHNYKITSDGVDLKLYVDAVLKDTITATHSFIPLDMVGRDGTLTYHHGKIEFFKYTDLTTPANSRQYDFNEGSGTNLVDSLGFGANKGSLINGAGWTDLGSGLHAVTLNLQEERVTFPEITLTGDFRIQMRLRARTTTGSYFLMSNSGSTNRLELYKGSTGISVFYNGSGLMGSDPISVNTWMDIELVRVGTTLTVYKDGNPDNSVTQAGDMKVSLLGNRLSWSINPDVDIEYFNVLDDSVVSNSRQYPFNEGAGTQVDDALDINTTDGTYINPPALDAQWVLISAGGTTHEASISLTSAIQAVTSKQAIFGASSGFDVSSDIDKGSQAVFETAASISNQLGFQASLGAFIDASATFNSDMNQLSIAVGNLIAQSAISFNSTIQVSNSKVLDAGATLVTSQDLASTSTVSTEVVSGFALNSNQVSVSQQDFLANSVMSTSQGFDGTAESNLLASMSMGSIINLQSVSGSDINASASLLVSSLLSTSFSTAIEGTGSYGVSCAIASQVIAELTSEASFDVVSGMISQANAILLAQAQLNTGNTFSVKSGQVIEAYGELTVTSSIGVDGVVVLAIEFKPLKDGHNVLVLAQNKTVTVTKQDRNIIVLN